MQLPAIPDGVRLLGLCGAPGVGKSAAAAALAARDGAVVVPMDGFHYPQAELGALEARRAMLAGGANDAASYVGEEDGSEPPTGLMESA